MAKGAKKAAKRGGAAAKRPAKKEAAARPARKTAKRAAPSAAVHDAVFKGLAAHSNTHNKAPVCYQLLGDGSYLICFLQSDGSYGQCQPYSGPIHQPPCG